ncbi:MAG: TetR/AcrR family transcriptional regulator [Lachnospiraceae bacterium]|nr:TetR/AcrR family transcriptional regulator [Lachnospiraceae bacterium]
MSYSSSQTRNRILECAKEEFLTMGFQKANLRSIANQAKATTGALYNHFKNKEVLFEALVEEPAQELLAQFKERHESLTEFPENDSLNGTDWMLDYIYDHFDAFRLIFCCSEGHQYSGFLDELAAIEESAYKKHLPSSAHAGEPVDDFFIHVVCASGFRELYEVVSHNLSKEEAIHFMNKVKQFRMAGWKEILGQ